LFFLKVDANKNANLSIQDFKILILGLKVLVVNPFQKLTTEWQFNVTKKEIYQKNQPAS
jgi:hypothetical protein